MKVILSKRELKSLTRAAKNLAVGGVNIFKTEAKRGTIVIQRLSDNRFSLTIYSEEDL